MINANGQYGNVPLLHALVSGFDLVHLALLIVHCPNFADMRPSLATRWGSRRTLLYTAIAQITVTTNTSMNHPLSAVQLVFLAG